MEYQLEKTAEEIRNESGTIYQRFGLGGDQTYYYNRSAAPEEIANVADGGKSVAASGDTSTG